MESHFVTSIPGIEYYPIVALVFFFGFFTGLIAWFFLHNRKRLEAFAYQPLEEQAALPATRNNSTLAL
jgi:cytochrome c oxidase cbb3-type subunit IV